jgi:hypothetical protein
MSRAYEEDPRPEDTQYIALGEAVGLQDDRTAAATAATATAASVGSTSRGRKQQ